LVNSGTQFTPAATRRWLIARGARPRLEKLLAFFPGRSDALELSHVTVSSDADVAVAQYDVSKARALRPLPLSSEPGMPGDPVTVVGYPMGVRAMVAKSPRPVYRRLVSRRADFDVARELAALSLIRPLATQGHLGDVVGDKLVYDAVTAQGGSGGPVFNHEGRVIGLTQPTWMAFPAAPLACRSTPSGRSSTRRRVSDRA
jgi:S1-C subfamily serine protease